MSEPQSKPGLFPDSRPDIPSDDWEDQDLLTKDEAQLRLDHSAKLVEAELAQARSSNPGAVAGLEDQLRKINAVLVNLRR